MILLRFLLLPFLFGSSIHAEPFRYEVKEGLNLNDFLRDGSVADWNLNLSFIPAYLDLCVVYFAINPPGRSPRRDSR